MLRNRGDLRHQYCKKNEPDDVLVGRSSVMMKPCVKGARNVKKASQPRLLRP
jgi:hypothetical protein